jgi:hypothetical protein
MNLTSQNTAGSARYSVLGWSAQASIRSGTWIPKTRNATTMRKKMPRVRATHRLVTGSPSMSIIVQATDGYGASQHE